MKRQTVSVEPERVHRLTLAELAAHDDACSDAMIDNAYFKSQIRKNKTKYFPLRIKEDDIPQILLHKVIVQKDVVAAEKELLRIPGLKRYRASLRSKAEQENFLKHLRKYIDMYQTDCPWEVSTTNRYTITTYEAAVTARQRVKQGQIIKYLVGTLVPLTLEESADLDHTNRNFSIVVSSRKKNSSIFLGPARFANHDCDANGRLVTRGADAMEVIAMKNIEIGDELTVSYGDDYFGPGNMDCLCHTCERLVRNGWAAAREQSESPRNSVLSSQEPGSPVMATGKRKRGSGAEALDNTALRPSKRTRAKPSPSKLQHSWTPTSSANSDVIEVSQGIQETSAESGGPTTQIDLTLSPPASPAGHTNQLASFTSRDGEEEPSHNDPYNMMVRRRSSEKSQSTKERKSGRPAGRFLVSSGTPNQYPLSPASTTTLTGESVSAPSSAEIGVVPDQVTIKVESIETSQVESDTIVVRETGRQNMSTPTRHEEDQQQNAITKLTTTTISKITPLIVADNSSIIPSIEPTVLNSIVATTTSQMTVTPLADKTRTPGDYLLTRKLLAQPHDRWVQCHNERCQCFFIQPNGYQTRRECPRCERHSMLYGFTWPKTDPDPRKILERSPGGRKGKAKTERSAYRRAGKCGKGSWYEGGGDEEERVMDHRVVHRFVLPEDEKATTRRGLLKAAEVARLSRPEFDPDDLNVGGRKRTESIGLGGPAESAGERGSLTPDGEARRRSNRFVTRVGVYADV